MASRFLLREVTDPRVWDGFIASASYASFPQSWAWGAFQQSEGHAIKRVVLEEEGIPVVVAQWFWHARRWFGYWFAPRGPVFLAGANGREREVMRAFLEAVEDARWPGRTLFYRVEPMLRMEEGEGVIPPWVFPTRSYNPSSTILLDLAQSEEGLLANMAQKTRYNVRLAAKHGVTIREGTSQDLPTFLTLTRETAERDQFLSHDDRHLQATFEALASNGMAKLRVAEYEGKVLAANMEIWFGDTVTYLHGASSSANRQVMAPYLLQWEAMRAAKASGARWYDLWGANPLSVAMRTYRPRWEGITRFKRGFGGIQTDLLGTWDDPEPHPWVYHLLFPQRRLLKR